MMAHEFVAGCCSVLVYTAPFTSDSLALLTLTPFRSPTHADQQQLKPKPNRTPSSAAEPSARPKVLFATVTLATSATARTYMHMHTHDQRAGDETRRYAEGMSSAVTGGCSGQRRSASAAAASVVGARRTHMPLPSRG